MLVYQINSRVLSWRQVNLSNPSQSDRGLIKVSVYQIHYRGVFCRQTSVPIHHRGVSCRPISFTKSKSITEALLPKGWFTKSTTETGTLLMKGWFSKSITEGSAVDRLVYQIHHRGLSCRQVCFPNLSQRALDRLIFRIHYIGLCCWKVGLPNPSQRHELCCWKAGFLNPSQRALLQIG